VADILSRCVEEIAVDLTEFLGFETTEITLEEYRDLVKDVWKNLENLPHLKIEDVYIFKWVSLANLDDEGKGG